MNRLLLLVICATASITPCPRASVWTAGYCGRVVLETIVDPNNPSERAWAMFTPFRTLAQAPGVKIVGSILADTAKPWEVLAQEIGHFDRTMVGLGFTKPEAGRVAVIDRDIFHYWDYSAILPGRIWNIGSGRMEETIILKTSNVSGEALRNTTGLFHERAHSFLGRNYNPNSLVFKNQAVEEALADFLDAYIKKERTTTVRRGLIYDNGVPIRDIAEKISYSSDTDDDYLTSLFMSNALWILGEEIGEKKMSALIKPFIDGLNIYQWSFEEINEEEPFLSDIVGYFLAVLKKSARDIGESEAADRIIAKVTTRLDLNADRIDKIEISLADAKTLIENSIAKETQANLGSMDRNTAIDKALEKVGDEFDLSLDDIGIILKGDSQDIFGYDEAFDHYSSVRGHIEGTTAAVFYPTVLYLYSLLF